MAHDSAIHSEPVGSADPSDMAEAIARGHEPSDVQVKGIVIFMLTLAAAIIVCIAVSFAVIKTLSASDESKDQVRSPLAREMTAPAYAPLQPSRAHNTLDWEDVATMRQAATEVLNGRGTGANGRQFIPVTEAMGLVAGQLEVHQVAVDQSNGAAPGNNGGGR